MADNSKDNEQIHIVTNGSNIRFEPAKSSRGSKSTRQKIVLNVAQEMSPVSGFVGFLRDHAVVGLSIGVVIGAQVQALIKQMVASFLDPLTQLLFGTALSARTFTLHFHQRAVNFNWGGMIYALIIFLLVLVTIYALIKILKLDKLDKPVKS